VLPLGFASGARTKSEAKTLCVPVPLLCCQPAVLQVLGSTVLVVLASAAGSLSWRCGSSWCMVQDKAVGLCKHHQPPQCSKADSTIRGFFTTLPARMRRYASHREVQQLSAQQECPARPKGRGVQLVTLEGVARVLERCGGLPAAVAALRQPCFSIPTHSAAAGPLHQPLVAQQVQQVAAVAALTAAPPPAAAAAVVWQVQVAGIPPTLTTTMHIMQAAMCCLLFGFVPCMRPSMVVSLHVPGYEGPCTWPDCQHKHRCKGNRLVWAASSNSSNSSSCSDWGGPQLQVVMCAPQKQQQGLGQEHHLCPACRHQPSACVHGHTWAAAAAGAGQGVLPARRWCHDQVCNTTYPSHPATCSPPPESQCYGQRLTDTTLPVKPACQNTPPCTFQP
jgi:hypothetical protein